MPKMTAKYSTALTVARREKVPVSDHQEELNLTGGKLMAKSNNKTNVEGVL